MGQILGLNGEPVNQEGVNITQFIIRQMANLLSDKMFSLAYSHLRNDQKEKVKRELITFFDHCSARIKQPDTTFLNQ